MKTELELVLLEEANGYLKSLSDAEFLALTCNLTILHDGLIRLVHNQSIRRNLRSPIRVTADVFLCTKRNISKCLNPKIQNFTKEEL